MSVAVETKNLTDGFVSGAIQALAKDLDGILDGTVRLLAPSEPEWIDHNLAIKQSAAECTENKGASLAKLRGMPIDISVEAGSIHLTLEQLLDIEQGSLLELRLLEGHQVKLKLAGVSIGEGQVLNDGERLFIEVQKVFDNREGVCSGDESEIG